MKKGKSVDKAGFYGCNLVTDNLWCGTIGNAARLTEDLQRFSGCFFDITDLTREAAFYSEREAQALVSAKHVELAIEARTYR